MKTYLTFTLLLIVAFIGTAQNADFNTIEESIAIKPVLTSVDFNDGALTFNHNSPSFSITNDSEYTTKPTSDFYITASQPEIFKTDFTVFSHKNLKNNFFRDFNSTYKRGELERLLPRSLDPSYYSPCIGGD